MDDFDLLKETIATRNRLREAIDTWKLNRGDELIGRVADELWDIDGVVGLMGYVEADPETRGNNLTLTVLAPGASYGGVVGDIEDVVDLSELRQDYELLVDIYVSNPMWIITSFIETYHYVQVQGTMLSYDEPTDIDINGTTFQDVISVDVRTGKERVTVEDSEGNKTNHGLPGNLEDNAEIIWDILKNT